MNKQLIFDHYANILDEIIDSSNFFKYYFQYPTSLDEDVLSDYCTGTWPCDIDMRFGATRGCVIDNNYNYVVKFNIRDYNYGEFFESCEKEERIYSLSRKVGLSNYLTEAQYIGTYHKEILFYDAPINCEMSYYNEERASASAAEQFESEEPYTIYISIPLYAYPRMEKIGWRGHELKSEQEERMLQSYHSPLGGRDLTIAAEFIREYGMDEFEKFSTFLKSERVNDIHTGNVAIIDNNKMVLIDYAGYWEGDYDSDELSKYS